MRLLRAELIRAAREEGLAGAIRSGSRLFRGGLHRTGAYLAESAVDLWLGTRTRGIVHNEAELHALSPTGDGHHYQAVALRKWRRILAAVDLDPAGSTFLDLGAGRGRAMLFAAEAGFARTVGVELDPALAADAERNIDRWRARRGRRADRPLSVLVADAATVELPDGPVLVLVYNSFGPETLRRVLARVVEDQRRHPRPVRLCYLNAQHPEVVAEQPALVPIARDDDWILYTIGSGTPGGGTEAATERSPAARTASRGRLAPPPPA
ncbi:SAM-dependent methyltransferase [Geodermatophilus sp. URMC 60]